MKWIMSTAVVLVLALGQSASARAAGGETISTDLTIASFPAAAPYVGTYSAPFTASGEFSDSGTVTIQARFAAVPSPVSAVLQSVRTFVGSKGTLTVRCSQVATRITDPANILDTGSCVVLEATGAYVGLNRQGAIAGVANVAQAPATLKDYLTL